MRGLLLNYQYGMWDAVLKKIKTNTRRGGGLHSINENPEDYKFIGFLRKDTFNIVENNFIPLFAEFTQLSTGKIVSAPIRFKPGSNAYLQEPILRYKKEVFYQYSDPKGNIETIAFFPLIEHAIRHGAEWENKYFMAEINARYFVKFTDVKVQRLSDISEADCLAEGIQKQYDSYYYTKDGVKVLFPTAQKAYFSLYNAVNNCKENNNPWLFSYYFELCQKP